MGIDGYHLMQGKIPRKRIQQIAQYVEETDDNAKQFARELNELPTSEDNRDNIMLQDIINKMKQLQTIP